MYYSLILRWLAISVNRRLMSSRCDVLLELLCSVNCRDKIQFQTQLHACTLDNLILSRPKLTRLSARIPRRRRRHRRRCPRRRGARRCGGRRRQPRRSNLLDGHVRERAAPPPLLLLDQLRHQRVHFLGVRPLRQPPPAE